MPGPKSTKTVLLPPALIAGAARAAGGAGAGAGAEMEPALRAKKRGARASKAEKIAEKLAEHRHKISAALAALVEADATKAEVAKYFKMRVEQLADEAA
jgi:oligoendopeptidase F